MDKRKNCASIIGVLEINPKNHSKEMDVFEAV